LHLLFSLYTFLTRCCFGLLINSVVEFATFEQFVEWQIMHLNMILMNDEFSKKDLVFKNYMSNMVVLQTC